jgi:uncharacterized Zn-binding protein involved in type VI secretion
MMPAARVLDWHVCPMFTPAVPPIPHVGGPVLPPGGIPVLVGGMPAARASDMCFCVGPPDVIAQGAATVLVKGLPAARMLDSEAHGGLLILGSFTVLIGGPTFSARSISFNPLTGTCSYGKGITIGTDPTDPAYQSKVLATLIRLDSTPTMHGAIDALEASGHTENIIPYVAPAGWGPYNAYCQPGNAAGATTPGTGSDSTVAWSPSVNGFGPPGTTPNSSQPGSDIILAHEMIHGVHNATGTQGTGMSNAQGINVHEERNTVGLPATTYNDPTGATGPPANGTALPDTTGLPYTENGVRGDYASRGIDSPVTGSPPVQRPSYYPPTATDGPGGPF